MSAVMMYWIPNTMLDIINNLVMTSVLCICGKNAIGKNVLKYSILHVA